MMTYLELRDIDTEGGAIEEEGDHVEGQHAEQVDDEPGAAVVHLDLCRVCHLWCRRDVREVREVERCVRGV